MNYILENFYYSVIYDNRYKFILEGLLNTCTIAIFAVILGTIIGIKYYKTIKKN